MKASRKGSISLSINMIIVLIIAIVILGFALSFVTGLFRKAQVGLEGQFPEVPVEVNSENPIGIGSELLLKPGEIRKMSVRVLNIHTADITTGTLAITCSSGTAPNIESKETKTITPSSIETFKVVLKGTTGMVNNAICTATITPVTQSFFLNTK